MIEEITGRPEGTYEFRFTGTISRDDYEKVLVPRLQAAFDNGEHVKVLAHLDEGFEGYDLKAAWDDTYLGLHHWHGFERIAVVTDTGWVRNAIHAMALMMPCPVQVFSNSRLDEARLWLSESMGSIHAKVEDGILKLTMLGKLEPSSYDNIEEDLNRYFSSEDNNKLLIDLREFEGWEGLSAFSEHLALVRKNRKFPDRVAVVGNKRWQHVAESVFAVILHAKVAYFRGDAVKEAESWLKS
ncbi:STAS/SEC14 domain-containing protein [Rhodobacteraceae bacterium RKSG542]|uniref:STAS/SEC14 domain-containing protein n=1 Tax=Pseudovibrio flavus TaxID=2529854 RepID=UPI0012BD7A3F|nr:STAS/SEC14 domain-containing protein [Pseudovibrio flavus]MTI18223.1 STAS/SEC14 domain-containing protein [Pseudovibrio flavus]